MVYERRGIIGTIASVAHTKNSSGPQPAGSSIFGLIIRH